MDLIHLQLAGFEFARLQYDLDWVLMAQSREAWAAVEQHFVHVGMGDVQ